MPTRRRILVVDDLELNRRLLQVILHSRGYEVIEVDGGEAALATLAREPIDLVLLDYRMPRMNGVELCRRIRADEAHRFVPLVMLTATAESIIRREARAAGADDFLPKPFDVDELVARVRGLLVLRDHYVTSEVQRRAAELEARRWRLVSDVASAVGQCRDHAGLLAAIVGALGADLGIDRASYYELRADGPHLVAAVGGGAGPDASATEAIAPVVIGGRRRGVIVFGRAGAFGEADRATLDELAVHLGNAVASVCSQLDAVALEAARREVFAVLVHDFKNPLTVILANLDSLDEDVAARSDPEVMRDLRAAATQLLDMTLDLLDVGSAEDGRLVVAATPADVGALVAREVAAQRPRRRPIALELGGDATATVDPRLVRRAITNLLTSVQRRCGAGGRVEVTVARDHDDIVVRVADDGPGIAPEAMARMFEKYPAQAPGELSRGMGLYLCRLVIQAHRGTLSVADRAGGGAVFEARLPVTPTA
ncbi:MAG: response regulator [Deltaproteobacteria bacterium]|nr:response regulator [Deltaproteobacteria bacterium]